MSNENELQVLLRAAKRIPWSVARPLLDQCNINQSTGWVPTIAKLSSWSSTEKRFQDALQKFKSIFMEHILVGEKMIMWFTLPKPEIKNFATALSALSGRITKTYSGAYPLPVSDEILTKINGNEQELTKVEEDEKFVTVVFCSKRTIRQRENIPQDRFDSDPSFDWIREYQQVIGYKRIEFQSYDIVVLNKETGLLEFRIDVPDGLLKEDIANCKNLLAQKLRDELLPNIDISNVLRESGVNFFPAVDRIYNAKREGSVFELYFTAVTGSNNFGKMRSKEKDLRKESFHKAGADKVGISPYRIGIVWKSLGRIFHPELHLPGSIKLFSGPKIQSLDVAFIRNCTGLGDYLMVSSRLLKYL